MLTLKGECLSINEGKTKKGDKFKVLQVLSNGGKYVRVLDVVDYDNGNHEKGPVELPVRVSPYQTKQGRLGLNYIVQNKTE